MLLKVLLALPPAPGSPHPSRAALDLERILAGEELSVRRLAPDEDLWQELRRAAVDLIVLDAELLGDRTAAVVEDMRGLPEEPEVVVFSSQDDAASRAALLAAGAYAIVNPDVGADELAGVFRTLTERRVDELRLVIERREAGAPPRLGELIANSPTMREFVALVRKVADSDSTLLILGETGVGKEVIARAIHQDSSRRHGPFIAVNCSALSPSLLESELFGHVEGAFTGAHRARRGYFELAHGGTLFIDEVGELSGQLQVKLLRAIQDRKVQPVGAEEEIDVDVRILAATNRKLPTEVEAGRFRSDLYYRLSVVALEVPPLRQRQEDIAALARVYVEQFRVRLNRKLKGLREDTLELLQAYAWPGNVRELANCAERAVLLCESEWITPADLPAELRVGPEGAVGVEGAPVAGVPGVSAELLEKPFRSARKELIADFERRYLAALLARCHGRLRDAARMAEINPRSLYEKMQRHGLRKESFQLGAEPTAAERVASLTPRPPARKPRKTKPKGRSTRSPAE